MSIPGEPARCLIMRHIAGEETRSLHALLLQQLLELRAGSRRCRRNTIFQSTSRNWPSARRVCLDLQLHQAADVADDGAFRGGNVRVASTGLRMIALGSSGRAQTVWRPLAHGLVTSATCCVMGSAKLDDDRPSGFEPRRAADTFGGCSGGSRKAERHVDGALVGADLRGGGHRLVVHVDDIGAL